MTVRRLHSEQPPSFAFTAGNMAWAMAQIAKYPEGKQASAVIPVLWRVQEQEGWVSEPAIRAVADLLGMSYIRVLEIATFYTMFQLAPVGSRAHVQVCGTTPCMLRGAPDLIKVCKDRIAPHPHELSEDGTLSWEEVECLGSCANAPMVQIGSDTFEDLNPDILHSIIRGFEKGNPPAPGSQTGRVASCPETGPTTLMETAAAYKSRRRAAADAAPVAFGRMHPQNRERTDHEAGQGGLGTGLVTSHIVVGEESVGDTRMPRLISAPRNGQADDLKLIAGIGPMLEKELNKLGIWHFDQIATWDVMNLKWIDQQLEDFRGRAGRERWIEQARRLVTGWRPEPGSGGRPKGS